MLYEQSCLTNIAGDPDAREILGSLGVVDLILSLIEKHLNNVPYVLEGMRTLSKLAAQDELSAIIAGWFS